MFWKKKKYDYTVEQKKQRQLESYIRLLEKKIDALERQLEECYETEGEIEPENETEDEEINTHA